MRGGKSSIVCSAISLLVGLVETDGLAAAPTSISTNGNSFVELIEPSTDCRVSILGCLHGSESSANDVVQLLTPNDDEEIVVVLELCAGRFADLMRARSCALEEVVGVDRAAPTKRENPMVRFISMVAMMNEKRGLSTALAAALLSGASGLTNSLSGFKPGLEFSTATSICQKNGWDVILADQTVDETLQQMGRLPSISISMLLESIWKGWTVGPLGKASKRLQYAVFGDSNLDPRYQLRMAIALFRSSEVVSELIRLLMPIFLVMFLVDTATGAMDHQPMNWIDPLSSPSSMDFDSSIDPFATLQEIVLNAAATGGLLAMAYILLALPTAHVVLAERDEFLARGIQKACEIAVLEPHKEKRVVAVIGMMHVNNVARHLVQASRDAR